MHPTPIPDAEVYEGEVRKTLGAPPGLERSVRPIETAVAHGELEGRPSHVYRIRIEVPPDEAARLAHGEPFWLTLWGGVAPFDVQMHELCACDPPTTMAEPGPYCPTCGGGLHPTP